MAPRTTFATIRPLTMTRNRDVAETFERMAAVLAESGETANVQITLRGAEEVRHWSLELMKEQATATSKAKRASQPDLEIIVRESTWWDIAEGRLPPPEALRAGKLRLRGDAHLASRLYRQMAAENGSTEVCVE